MEKILGQPPVGDNVKEAVWWGGKCMIVQVKKIVFEASLVTNQLSVLCWTLAMFTSRPTIALHHAAGELLSMGWFKNKSSLWLLVKASQWKLLARNKRKGGGHDGNISSSTFLPPALRLTTSCLLKATALIGWLWPSNHSVQVPGTKPSSWPFSKIVVLCHC